MTKSIQPTTRHKLAMSLSTVWRSADVAYMARRIVQSLAIPSYGIDRPSCRERTSRIDIITLTISAPHTDAVTPQRRQLMVAARCCPESRDAPPGLTISRIVVKQVEMADRGTTDRARQFHEGKRFAQPNKRPDILVKPGEDGSFWQVPSSAIQKILLFGRDTDGSSTYRPQEPIASLGVVGAGNNSAQVALCLVVFGDGRALGSSYR
jgi:hypothetical protein